MSKAWKEKALELGKIIQESAKAHPELHPLCMSFKNFARKHHIYHQSDTAALSAILEKSGLSIITTHDVEQYKITISRQVEEIKALEFRISTLMRP